MKSDIKISTVVNTGQAVQQLDVEFRERSDNPTLRGVLGRIDRRPGGRLYRRIRHDGIGLVSVLRNVEKGKIVLYVVVVTVKFTDRNFFEIVIESQQEKTKTRTKILLNFVGLQFKNLG